MSDAAALGFCALCSAGALALALPLTSRFKPQEETKLTPEEAAHIEGDTNWLTNDQAIELNVQRRKEGKELLMLKYGSFEQDRDWLPLLRKLAHQDLQSMRLHLQKMLEMVEAGGPRAGALEKRFAEMAANQQAASDRGELDEDAAELGAWIGKYLTDAGYMWQFNPTMFKQIIVSAFPPLPRVDRGAAVRQAVPALLRWIERSAKLEAEVTSEGGLAYFRLGF